MTDKPEPHEMSATSAAEDELVSAVLDGEATESERAAVLADPRLSARREAFERVRAGLSVGHVDSTTRESAIRTAAESATSETGTPESSTVIALAKQRRRRQVATIVAVAAALLVVVPLLAITLIGTGSEQQVSTDAAMPQADDSNTAGPGASSDTVEEVSEAASGLALPTPVDVGDLGVLASTSELRDKVNAALRTHRERRDAPTDAPASTTSTVVSPRYDAYSASRADEQQASCASAIVRMDPSLGPTPVLSATATWAGEPAIVYVFRSHEPGGPAEVPGGPAEVIVVSRFDCSVVESVPA